MVNVFSKPVKGVFNSDFSSAMQIVISTRNEAAIESQSEDQTMADSYSSITST